MLSSDETVTEEDVDRAGVEVGVATLTSDRALACASAWETAERYEAALAGRLDGDLDILNIECEGDAEFIAIGEGMVGGKKRKSAGLNTVQRRKRASGFVAVVCVVAVEGNRGGWDVRNWADAKLIPKETDGAYAYASLVCHQLRRRGPTERQYPRKIAQSDIWI